MALTDFQDLVDDLVRDGAGDIATADRDEAIARAAIRYSTDRPKIKVEDVVAAGGNYLDLPASYDDDFSHLVEIETPPGAAPPDILESAAWSIYSTPTGDKILFVNSLAAAAAVRLRYTIPHTLDAVTDTIPDKDREAVCAWGAALLLTQLAAKYSGDSLTTIQSDSVDHQDKGRDYAARAKELRQRYLDHLGIDPKRTVPAGAVVDLDRNNSLGGDRLIHSRTRR